MPLVLLEALLIAFFWVFTGAQLPRLLNRSSEQKSRLISLIGLLTAVVIGLGLIFIFPAGSDNDWSGDAVPWNFERPEEPALVTTAPPKAVAAPVEENGEKQVDDALCGSKAASS